MAESNPEQQQSTAPRLESVESDRPREIDPAAKSLSDALKVSFSILKVLMIVLVIVYVFSGTFRVPEGNQAVKLRFGQIVGEPGKQVLEPRWYLNAPMPIGDYILVPTASQQLSINQAFWFEGTPGQTIAEMAGRAGPLNPLKDGSLLTGDANIVHARYDLSYTVSDVVAYVENVGDPELARNLVRDAAERGIVRSVAEVEADELIGGRANQDKARRVAQRALDDIDAGITIQTFAARSTAMPLSVRPAYQQVSNAENERAKLIDEARKEYADILGQTAGAAYTSLYELVQAFESATSRGDTDEANQLRAELDSAIADLQMSDARGGQRIGGEVAEVINTAITDRTQIVESVKAEADTFNQLLSQYRQSPELLTNRLWQEARREVFTGDVETIYAPTGDLWIETGNDPAVAREREQRRLEAERERVRQTP